MTQPSKIYPIGPQLLLIGMCLEDGCPWPEARLLWLLLIQAEKFGPG